MNASRGAMITMVCYLFQLALFLVFAEAHNQLHYYITPSPKVYCPGDPCLTLAQLATYSSNYLGSVASNNTTVTISLSFLPGNHSLDGELSLSQAANFSMTNSMEDDGTVFIECESQSGRFIINETTFVAVKKLNFVGCGDNRVSQVGELVVEDTTFQGVKGGGTGLVLKNVTTVHITRSSFNHNIRCRVNVHHKDYFFGDLLPVNTDGRALKIEFSNVSIISCNFTNNTVAADIANSSASLVGGGALYITNSTVSIVNSTFTHNTAWTGGALLATTSHLYIFRTIFCHNRARYGGVMVIKEVAINIDMNHFGNNTAELYGGVMLMDKNSFTISISGTTFDNNTAKSIGGVISTHGSLYNITNSTFINNRVTSDIGVFFFAGCSIHIANSTFGNNSGSLYIFSSNLTLSGYSTFENFTEPSNKTRDVDNKFWREGGAITSIHSNMIFTGESKLLNNRARYGGAMLATESKIMMYGEITVENNSAIMSGGGIFLQQSDIEIKGHNNITIFNNHARMGGGIHASSSVISVYQPGTLHVIGNKADDSGGGLYLEVNPKIYMYIKMSGGQQGESEDLLALILFHANRAKLGGAVHVADNTNSGACSPDNDKLNECFIQTFPLYPSDDGGAILYAPNTVSILFSDNIASEQGANLFGGLLDRCSPTLWPFDIQFQNQMQYSGIGYLSDISNIILTALDTISSLPVRICFCKNMELDCSYEPAATKVTKGKSFNVSLVAVDQANHSVDANIRGFLSSPGSTLKKGHQHSVKRNCTNVTFNVFSPHESEELSLYADGPCGQSILSVRRLNITFTDCTCPVGFEALDTEERCECICDSRLHPAHITNCDIATSSLVRVNTTAWIDYIDYTNPPGYIIHPNCPFDYCKPLTENISMNLNDSDGADEQCAYDRTGILCGGCQEHLSLSLGSSRCVPCQTHWPVVFIVILIAAIVAGILLVTALLALNITVAVGLINGFIFYANIVAANSAVFFPSTEISFPTVFIAWLNLDIGIDVCFIDGLDTCIKTWLQLFFPTYIISLVVIVIIISEYSPRFAGLIGKKDPIATLATLILLSYAKLLSVCIIIFLPADLDYPDGSRVTVWLLDGSIKYCQQKHSALCIVALLIILIIIIPYTILLFLWQWIMHAPKWKIFKWTRNTKFNAFISVHHAPYNSNYRYWTGLQLLVRGCLFAIVSQTNSKDPQASLLATIILVGGLLTLKTARVTVYKSWFVDVIDTGLNFNLLALSAFSFYHLKIDNTKQTAVLYTSTVITLVLLVGAVIYHIFLLIKKDKRSKEEEGEDGVPLGPVQPTNVEITHTVIEIAQPCDESAPPQSNHTDGTQITMDYMHTQ